MQWFMNMKIGKKLISSFILVALIAGVVGVISINDYKLADSQYRSLYENYGVAISYVANMDDAYQQTRVTLRNMMLEKDPAKLQQYANQITTLQNIFTTNMNQYTQTISLDTDRQNFAKVQSDWQQLQPINQQEAALSLAGKQAQAYQISQTQGSSITTDLNNALSTVLNFNVTTGRQQSKLLNQNTNSTVTMLILIVLIGMVVAVVLGLLLTRIISTPVKELEDAAEKMAMGDLEFKIVSKSKDEIGRLMSSFEKMVENIRGQAEAVDRIAAGDLNQEVKVSSAKDVLGRSLQQVATTLRNLIAEMDHMSQQHDAGDIDVYVPEEKFNGAYKVMAAGVNKMVSGHITVKKKAMACVAEFAQGNLDAELEKFPGKKAFINDNLEALRANIKQFIAEMDHMSHEHDAGDIDVYVPEEKFKGAYRVMAAGVNKMVSGHIAVKKKAMACVAEFAQGNFEAELEKFPGKKAFINENMEALRKNLKEVNVEVLRLVEASNAGKLTERANAQAFSGDWKKLISGLNGLIDAIIEPVQEAALVLEEMAKGNLQVSVKGDYKGDHAKIKNSLNDTITTLYSYVNEISSVLVDMANGNLDVGITAEYRGDFIEIKNSLNNIIQAFNNVLHDINNAAAQVAAGARQVSDSAQILSQGSTEQASSIEQLTASMEEIATQTRQNAVNANQANELALAAKGGAIDGNEQMQGMLKAMDEINDSSSNISKIIKVIDEIAFQTNILALNAAVEAARAGQHGKGFAVVAEEVRNLAARSANAAKETTGLIEGSIKKVEGGTKIANATAEALTKIVDGVTKAANLVGDIATASDEQASGIAQVNQGITQVSDVTQNNSATSEESAASSEELSSQAEVLREQVGRFKLKQINATTSRQMESINPEVLKMLENMAESSKHKPASASAYAQVAAAGAKHIDLSDKEFGKY